MWNPDSFMDILYERAEAERKKGASALSVLNISDRRKLLLGQLRTSLGSFESLSAPLNPVLLETTEYEEYIRERVEIGTLEGLRVPVYVLIPKNRQGRLPAVLALHGHGYGSREIVGLMEDGSLRTGSPGIHGDFALELMLRGNLVVAPEIIGFGDRRLQRDITSGKKGNSSCVSLTGQLLMYGMSIAGLRVFEALRALDYLASREDADPNRIGCMGFSGGGLLAAYAAALDERIRATILCGFTNTFKGSIMSINHCIDNFVPGILQYAELPELIGLLAPRALFIESGENDPLFPVENVKEAIEALTDIYRQEGAESRLRYDLFPGSHEISGRHSYPWLDSVLSADAG